MTTETMDKDTRDLDEYVSFGPKKNSTEFEKDAIVPDNWYWCRLIKIGRPFPKTNTKYNKEEMKAAFEFVIMGEADKQNDAVESQFATGQLTDFVNIEGWGDRSKMMPLCTALLHKNADEYRKEVGRDILPSELVGNECWIRVSTQKDKDGNFKSWPQEYKAELDKIEFGIGKPVTPAAPQKAMPQAAAIPAIPKKIIQPKKAEPEDIEF